MKSLQQVLGSAIIDVHNKNEKLWQEKLKELYRYANQLEELKEQTPEGYIALRLAVSCFLTMRPGPTGVEGLKLPLLTTSTHPSP